MSKFLTIVCTYHPPTPPKTQPQNPNPQTPCEEFIGMLYGQTIGLIVNKIHYSYLHMRSGVVGLRRAEAILTVT